MNTLGRTLTAAVLGLALSTGGCVLAIGNTATMESASSEVISSSGYMDMKISRDSRLKVYDADTDQLLYMGEIRRGQHLVFDGKTKLITVDGKVVASIRPENQKGYRMECVGE